MITEGDQWSSIQVVKSGIYNIIMTTTNRKSELKPDESKYDKTSGTTQITTSQDKYIKGIIQIRKPSSIYHIPHFTIIRVYTI